MPSNLTNEGQQYLLEVGFVGDAPVPELWLGLTNAVLDKTSDMSDVGSTEPVGNVSPPAAPVAALAADGAGNLSNGVYSYKVTFVTPDGETSGGTASNNVTVVDNSTNGKVNLTGIPTGSATITARKLYRTEVGGSDYLLLDELVDNTTTTYQDNIADGSLTDAIPTSNTTGQKVPPTTAPSVALAGDGAGNLGEGDYRYKITFVSPSGETEAGPESDPVTVVDNSSDGKVDLTDIPLGEYGVTARNIYRTEVDGADFLLLATINDNTTDVYEDNIADGSLTDPEPVENTTAPNGYKRFYLPSDVTSWVASALDAADWQISLDTHTWEAANAEGIGPVTYAFLCEDPSQYSGRLFGFWELSQTRTLTNTESMDFIGRIKEK